MISEDLKAQNQLICQQWALGGRKYVRVNWTKQEDQLMTSIVNASSKKVMWAKVARDLNSDFHKKEVRIGRQCKKRWFQVLLPLNKFEMTEEKEKIMLSLFQKLSQDKKQLYEECQRQIQGLNKDQVKIFLDQIIEKYNLSSNSQEILAPLKIKTMHQEDLDQEVTKKQKLNDSSVKVLCSSLAFKFI